MLRFYLAVIFSAIIFSSTAHATEKVVLQLKWLHQFQFAGFYAAKTQGYYAREGLDVEIRELDKKRTSVETVLSGDAQYGISDSSLVLSRLKGQPLVVIAAIFQHSPMVMLTLESSGILSPLELKDKRVMYRKNVDDAVLRAMFTELRLTNQDYLYVPHTFQDDALINDNVDAMSAYITDQPYFYKQRNISLNILSPANYGIDFYGDMIFVEQQYLNKNKEQVQAFRRASIKGWEYAIEHQEEMVDWILHNLNTNKSREHLLFEAQSSALLIRPQLAEVGSFSSQRLLRIADIYKQLNLAPSDAEISGIDFADYYAKSINDTRWLQAAGVILLTLTFITLILWIINQRLKKQVAIRTKELEEVNHSLQRYLEVVDHYTITSSTDLDGRITKVSQAFCAISGYQKAEIIGKTHSTFRHPDMPAETYRKLWQTLHSNKAWSGEILNRDKRGQDYWLYSEIEPIREIQDTIVGYTAVSVDITDKKKIETLSLTDSLTGLANRRQLDDVFAQSMASAKRYQKHLSIVMLDIDNFKAVNDNYGHCIGDLVIKTFARLLKTNIRKGDIAGRWGGEEFLLICPETNLSGAQCVAELLRESVMECSFTDIPNQSCSFGVAQWDKTESLDNLLNRADKALYRAKDNGRNRVELSEF